MMAQRVILAVLLQRQKTPDSDGTADYIDTDSDNDTLLDSAESGLTLRGTDANGDGIDDDASIGVSYRDPDGVVNNPQTGLSNEIGGH